MSKVMITQFVPLKRMKKIVLSNLEHVYANFSFLENKRSTKFLGLESGSGSDKWSNQNSNPLDGISFNFGIDIEGYLHQDYLEGNLGRPMSRPDMELIGCEGEDSPVHVVDGKK
ncbi:hypothetical protein Goari_014707 [Gossypium aridum]|uniref:Uncharacterized protein n=1 Tax=Gossypium aridum TaxID=34290 RepID=A0A7J8XJA0_GOSAI|nr:hypothetical protein [Gossypium aridum]